MPAASVDAGWPVGWDVSFCRMFEDALIAQELLIDVERALAEDAERDARLLAVELSGTAGAVTEQLGDLGAWPGGEDAATEIGALMDLAAQAATEYTAYLEEGRRGQLRRARALRRENADAVPGANEVLGELADAGLACPGQELQLESP